MNIKNSILAVALALGLTGVASAQNVTYVGGATSFRNVANVVIANYASSHGGQLLATDAATLSSAANLLVSYTNGSGTNYIVAHWTGAGVGIQSAAGPVTGQSNAATVGFWNTNVTGWTNAPASAATATNQHTATVAFSENYQGTTIFNGPLRLANGQQVNYSSLLGFDGGDGVVAVSPYTWAGSRNFPSGATITAQVGNQIFASGNLPLTLITGNAADQTNSVFLLGRNIDSGARINVLAEIGYGVRTSISTYAVATGFTGGASNYTTATLIGTSQNTNLILYPAEIIDGVSSANAGNSGYNSGGTVVGLLTNSYASGTNLTVAGSPAPRTGTNFLIGFAALGDVLSKTNAGVVPIAYNGIPFSTNAVAQGQYTLWGYEHLYVSPNATAADSALALAWGNTILATPTSQLSPIVNVNDMEAGRNGDGQTVYSYY